MKRRERERLMRQGVVLPETPRDRRERHGLELDLIDNPVTGRPLRHRWRNFKPDVGSYLASLDGPLPYMTRLREIGRRVAEHERTLQALHETLDRNAWLAHVDAADFNEVNDLIERHNRWYPIEARLPMDPRTGDYVFVNGEHYGKRPLDTRWVFERFPSPPA